MPFLKSHIDNLKNWVKGVIDMLKEIGTKDRIPEFIKRAKDKDDPFRLMGFGHRVYKNYDPRAAVLKESCDEVLAELGIKNDPLPLFAPQNPSNSPTPKFKEVFAFRPNT